MPNLDQNRQILEHILTEFEALAATPRKSGYEKEVSEYLLKRAKELGFQVVQDEVNNIIIEKSATVGFENVPTTIIQGHMDMVCVCTEGRAYNPLTDPIKVLNDGKFLSAEGTSLGADDGIGVATALYLLQAANEHGPIRVIFTVDEENGMTGAKALDKKYLEGGYLINCDSEDVDMVTISSAGSINIDVKRVPVWLKPNHTAPYKFAVKGLLGGHSGMEINKGHANAIRVLGLALDAMKNAGIDFELAEIHGGTARNAIPASATSTIVIRDLDIYKVNNVIAKMNEYLHHAFGNIEKGYYLEFTPTTMPDLVLSSEDCKGTVNFICLVQNGVITMSQTIDGLVETSSNLGTITTGADEIHIQVYPRSAVDSYIKEIKQETTKLAELCGFKTIFSAQSPGWPANADSKLAPLVAEIFEEQNKKPMKSESIHAGLECSWFYEKNPELDMISIGPTLTGVHSPHEKLSLDTVVPHAKLILETLKRLKD